MTTDPIVLESHICDQRRSYKVTFEGPDAEAMALAYWDRHSSTHAISEWLVFDDVPCIDQNTGEFIGMRQELSEDQPYSINGNKFPQLYDRLWPTCEHGLSAHLCYGPDHYCSPEEIAMGW